MRLGAVKRVYHTCIFQFEQNGGENKGELCVLTAVRAETCDMWIQSVHMIILGDNYRFGQS